MPYTGLFLLRTVSGDFNPSTGHLSGPICIRATCLSCQGLLNAKAPPDIEHIAGGVILYCRNCGTRQAITIRHLEQFMAKT